MKIVKGDKVKILHGKERGKEGVVKTVFREDGKVLVEGVNFAKRHVKPGTVSKEGGIINVEKPLFVSNVAVMCTKCARPVRAGFTIVNGKKNRVCKRCGEMLGGK